MKRPAGYFLSVFIFAADIFIIIKCCEPQPAVLCETVLFFILSMALALAVHETGHLAGGLLSGYRLLFIRIGPFSLEKNKKGGLNFNIEKKNQRQCAMYPSSLDEKRYFLYNAGGILANLICTALAAAICFALSGTAFIFFIQLCAAGLIKTVFNCVVCTSDTVPSDLYILKLLKNNKAARKDYIYYLCLYADLYLERSGSLLEYDYERSSSGADDDLIYYNEIRKLLSEALK